MSPSVDFWSSARSQFPILSDCTYLNSAFTALTPSTIADNIRDFNLYDRASSVGPFSYVLERLDIAYGSIAQLLGSIDENGKVDTANIAICASCSDAIYKVSQALVLSGVSAGQNIVLSDIEYCSNVAPWVALQKRYSLEIRVATHDPNCAASSLENIIDKIDTSTLLVVVSHVSSMHGFVSDIQEICERARSCGALSLVDGAQAISTMKVNVRSIGCDFYVYSGHKALGTTGTGVLWASERGSELLSRLLPSPNYVDDGLPMYSRYWGNSMSNTEGILALGWAANYLLDIGINNIERRIGNLRNLMHDSLLDSREFHIISGRDYRNILSIYFDDRTVARSLVEKLYERRVICLLLSGNSFPLSMNRAAGGGVVRFSFHLYNSEEDVYRAMEAIQSVMEDPSF